MSIELIRDYEKTMPTWIVQDLDQGEFYLFEGQLFMANGDECSEDICLTNHYMEPPEEDTEVVAVNIEVKWSPVC